MVLPACGMLARCRRGEISCTLTEVCAPLGNQTMNVLQINNYHYVRGGANRYYLELSRILSENGHRVSHFSLHHPDNIYTEYSSYFGDPMTFDMDQSITKKVHTAMRMLYSPANNRKVERLIRDYPVEVAHAHNIHGRVCPSVLGVLRRNHVPVIMTLHDYKLGCPVYTFLRNNKICMECLKRGNYRVVVHSCTKNSLLQSMLHFVEATVHKRLDIYKKNVSLFVCPSKFSLEKHIEIGIPEQKLVHIPHFVNLQDFHPEYHGGSYILYVGRLSREKGLHTLISAVKGLDTDLRIVGNGPMRDECELFVRQNNMKNVIFEGYKSGRGLSDLYSNAAFVVVPSEWYEVFGLIIIEAFACGKPVIGSAIGAIPEMVVDNETGLLFKPGDYRDLREKMEFLLGNPSLIERMGRTGRKLVEEEYSEKVHYRRVVDTYQKVLAGR